MIRAQRKALREIADWVGGVHDVDDAYAMQETAKRALEECDMSQALVPLNFTAPQLALVRKTVAKDANQTEFDNFIEFCKLVRLNPLRKQCYLFIYNRDNPAKRQPVIVTAIDGLRAIADRTGNYRPDDKPARLAHNDDLKGPLNPMGLISAEVTVYKWSHGEWFASSGEARWTEFAPLQDVWADNPETGRREKTGQQVLDPKKEGWHRMPHLMLAKCAEAQALRKAFPEDLSGVYGEEETDRMRTIELTASEIADEADKEDRLSKIGGINNIPIDWQDGEAIQLVPVGKFFDAAMAFIRAHSKPGEEELSTILSWRDKNRVGLQSFWAYEKDAALQLKKELERVEQAAQAEGVIKAAQDAQETA